VSEKTNTKPCNIAKLLCYASENVSLKSHADKIIDLEEGSDIFMLRFGSPRTVLLTHKETGEKVEILVKPGSLFVLDYETNRHWTHGILPANEEQSQTAYSIILRRSVTYLHKPTLCLWGPRTMNKSCDDVRHTNCDDKEIIKHLWSIENKQVVSLDHYKQMWE
jgi:hypothetical protein